MGVRRDKGQSIARFITVATGIPGVRWAGNSMLDMPYPYQAHVTTARKLQSWHDAIAATSQSDRPVAIAIRYDNGMPDVAHAWAAMPLSTACLLIGHHYETIRERGQ